MPDPTFTGSCHCGTIAYTITLPPSFLTNPTPAARRCNCTICQKGGYTSLRIPSTSFTLISPTSKSSLPDYQPKLKNVHLYFCDKCGVQVFREGTYEVAGAKHELFSVNLGTLEQPQEGLDLRRFKMEYWDMRHDNAGAGPRDEPWEGGLV